MLLDVPKRRLRSYCNFGVFEMGSTAWRRRPDLRGACPVRLALTRRGRAVRGCRPVASQLCVRAPERERTPEVNYHQRKAAGLQLESPRGASPCIVGRLTPPCPPGAFARGGSAGFPPLSGFQPLPYRLYFSMQMLQEVRHPTRLASQGACRAGCCQSADDARADLSEEFKLQATGLVPVVIDESFEHVSSGTRHDARGKDCSGVVGFQERLTDGQHIVPFAAGLLWLVFVMFLLFRPEPAAAPA